MEGIVCYQDNQMQISEEEIRACFPLVKKMAIQIKRRLPSSIELDDLVQSGYLGLMEAAQHYSPCKDASFKTYASIRIHGAIIDFLRKNSWGSREAIRCMQQLSDAIRKIEAETQSQASADQIMQVLQVDAETYAKMCKLAVTCHISNIDVDGLTNLQGSDEDDPTYKLEKLQIKEMLKQTIQRLPGKQQLVLSLYYVEELTLQQIGEVLGLTEARICQLHAQAIAKIKDNFQHTL